MRRREPGASTSTQVGAVLAALVGLAFVLALDRPWSWDFTTQPWTRGYVIGSRGLLFALVGWVASQALGSTRLPTALARSAASLDAIALLPAARHNHGLRLALVFAGGVSLSLVFVPLDQLLSPASVLAHGAVIGLTMLIYASALWGVHQVLATAKARELGRVREELASAYGQLKQTDPAAPDLPILSARIAAWTSYERRLLDLPEWVHDAPTLRRLGASILLPAATLGMRLLLDRVR